MYYLRKNVNNTMNKKYPIEKKTQGRRVKENMKEEKLQKTTKIEV